MDAFVHNHEPNPWQPSLSRVIERKDGDNAEKLFTSKPFQTLIDTAYLDPKGYAIGDIAGEKTMVVSGSRNIYDHALNVLDLITEYGEDAIEYAADVGGAELGVSPDMVHKVRKAIDLANPVSKISKISSYKLSRAAKANGVKVVIGHSRGSKLVADMSGDYHKASIDGALVITPDKKLVNFAQSRGADPILAFSGKNNVWIKQHNGRFGITSRHGHRLWRGSKNYTGYKKGSTTYKASFLSPWGVRKKKRSKGSRT